MPAVACSALVAAPLATCWEVYFDPRTWPAWVDGFGATLALGAPYPEAGGELRWRSHPAGRGEVRERVLAHEPRRRHRVAFSDPAMAGELETTFAVEGERTRVTQALSYRLHARGPLARLAGALFVRGQLRASLARSLAGLALEAEARSRG